MDTPQPVFRPHKRRKVQRRHNDEEDSDIRPAPLSPAVSNAVADEDAPSKPFDKLQPGEGDGEQAASVADLLRLRKQAKARRGGIGFSRTGITNLTSNGLPEQDGAASDSALVPVQPEASATDAARSRFAPQTGTVAELSNEHMTAFIDARLSRLRSPEPSSSQPSILPPPTSRTAATPTSHTSTAAPVPPRQAASVGQIQEIDLGPTAATRNASLTEAAYRRLHGLPPSAEEKQDERPQKVRLDRHGKPRPPRPARGRQRRTSADLARDALVESLLKEGGLGLYDSPTTDAHAPVTGDDDRDTALAQAYEAEYLDLLAEQEKRREILNKKPPGPGGAGGSGTGTMSRGGGKSGKQVEIDLSKGPKLGGSRSARAAMHAAEKARAGGGGSKR